MTIATTGPRIRRDIQLLLAAGTPSAVLDAYAAAVVKMKELDRVDGDGPPTNPLSWRYQAALHGIKSFRNDPLWSTCRHNSWFFFAWHRMYLYRFESIVQHHLGDREWALPYWDYTKPDEEARRLPRSFRDPGTPDNPLFVGGRSTEAATGTPFDRAVYTDARSALRLRDFALPKGNPASCFGGFIVKDAKPDSDTRGALEDQPHASVHGAVGGLMGRFETAALDPIFWLHHANIDRLWEVWRALGNANPVDSIWLNTKFVHYGFDGKRTSLPIGAVLDTPALGYLYESIAPPSDFQPSPRRLDIPSGDHERIVQEEIGVQVMPSPELVGAANNVSFSEKTTVPIDLVEPRRALTGLGSDDERWFLRVENIHGDRANAAAYAVHLEAAAGHEEAVLVGTIGAFGIIEASRNDETHDGTGITDVFEITEQVEDLRARQAWDSSKARVTISPMGPSGGSVAGDDVRAGRVSFYRG